jgi:hypothetical protein
MRDVDDILDFIENHNRLSPVEKAILRARVNRRPTEEEIQTAVSALDNPKARA